MTPLPLVTGPFFNHTVRARRKKQFRVALVLVVVALLTLFLAHSLRAIVHNVDARFTVVGGYVERTSWLSEKECSRLMNYHGVSYLRITDNAAEIYRGGKWITVKRRGE